MILHINCFRTYVLLRVQGMLLQHSQAHKIRQHTKYTRIRELAVSRLRTNK